jgi:6-pyruvoyltetrahydropterin/6-carboxytetrahydropterin synthase
MYSLCVSSSFSAAHQLHHYPGACQRIHGHNWKVQASLTSGELNELGMVIDLMEFQGALNECLKLYDHRMINEISPFDQQNPTSENLARVIYDDLKSRLPESITLDWVRVFENEDYCVTYRPDTR